MSVSYRATVVAGFKLDPSALIRETQTRGCRHAEQAGAAFCSTCGSPTWKVEQERLGIDVDLPSGPVDLHLANTENFMSGIAEYYVLGIQLPSAFNPRTPSIDWDAMEKQVRQTAQSANISLGTSLFLVHLVKNVDY